MNKADGWLWWILVMVGATVGGIWWLVTWPFRKLGNWLFGWD